MTGQATAEWLLLSRVKRVAAGPAAAAREGHQAAVGPGFVEKQRCQRAVVPLVRCAGAWCLSRGDASNLARSGLASDRGLRAGARRRPARGVVCPAGAVLRAAGDRTSAAPHYGAVLASKGVGKKRSGNLGRAPDDLEAAVRRQAAARSSAWAQLRRRQVDRRSCSAGPSGEARGRVRRDYGFGRPALARP
jgi:hypothetical protein